MGSLTSSQEHTLVLLPHSMQPGRLSTPGLREDSRTPAWTPEREQGATRSSACASAPAPAHAGLQGSWPLPLPSPALLSTGPPPLHHSNVCLPEAIFCQVLSSELKTKAPARPGIQMQSRTRLRGPSPGQQLHPGKQVATALPGPSNATSHPASVPYWEETWLSGPLPDPEQIPDHPSPPAKPRATSPR